MSKFKVGDKVRFTSGWRFGMEGVVVAPGARNWVGVEIPNPGKARTTASIDEIELVPEEPEVAESKAAEVEEIVSLELTREQAQMLLHSSDRTLRAVASLGVFDRERLKEAQNALIVALGEGA